MLTAPKTGSSRPARAFPALSARSTRRPSDCSRSYLRAIEYGQGNQRAEKRRIRPGEGELDCVRIDRRNAGDLLGELSERVQRPLRSSYDARAERKAGDWARGRAPYSVSRA